MNRRTAQNGFTLIEAIAAIVILAVAMPAILLGISDAQRRRADPVMDERARWLAAETLEDIIADRHSSTRGYTYVINANYPAETTISGFTGFARSVTISETGADLISAGTGYKSISVTVSYPGANGAPRSFSLSTVVTEYTP